MITIYGNIPSKKNSKQIVHVRGRVLLLPSKNHKRWHDDVMQQLKSARVSLKKPESIQITVYPPTLRKYDLTNKAESIMDALVDAKIIEDDNVNVVPKLILIHGGKDKDNPRAEIIIS